jgi:hypothetical protein
LDRSEPSKSIVDQSPAVKYLRQLTTSQIYYIATYDANESI